MTVANDVLDDFVSRLDGSSAISIDGEDVQSVRRNHLTPRPKGGTPGIDVIDGRDRENGQETDCSVGRAAAATVRVVVRKDGGLGLAYVIANEALRRLNPRTSPYARGITVKFTDAIPTAQIADEDAIGLDLLLTIEYEAAPFSLSAPD